MQRTSKFPVFCAAQLKFWWIPIYTERVQGFIYYRHHNNRPKFLMEATTGTVLAEIMLWNPGIVEEAVRAKDDEM
jgi:hypothetical protein